jgi:hypothetical protein
MDNTSATRILRRAAIELQGADVTDVVKVAGIIGVVRRIGDMLVLTDKETRGRREKMYERGETIQYLIERLSASIERIQRDIANADVDDWEQAFPELQNLIGQAAVQIGGYKRDVDTAYAKTPLLSDEEIASMNEEIRWVNKGYRKDPEIMRRLKAMLPPAAQEIPNGYNIYKIDPETGEPLLDESRNRQRFNLSDFDWFRQFRPQDIRFTEKAYGNLVRRIKEALYESRRGIIPSERKFNALFGGSRRQTVERAFQEAILEAPLVGYTWSPVSEQVKFRQPNEMEIRVSLYNVHIPGSEEILGSPLYVDIGIFRLSDMAAAGKGQRPMLSVAGPATKVEVSPPEYVERVQARREEAEREQISPEEEVVPPEEAPPEAPPPPAPEPVEELAPEEREELTEEEILERREARRYELLSLAATQSAMLPPNFWVKFVQMCQRLGVHPYELAKVINHESGFVPSAQNPKGAKGLSQFIKRTATKGFGMSEGTWQNFTRMPAEEQIKWTEKFFRGKAKGKDAGQLFVVNLGRHNNPDGSLYASKVAQEAWIAAHPEDAGKFRDPEGQDRAVRYNAPLVEDGRITWRSATRRVSGSLPKQIRDQIDSALRAVGGQPPPPFQEPDPNWMPAGTAMPTEFRPQFASQPVRPQPRKDEQYQGLMQWLFRSFASAGPVTRIVRRAMEQDTKLPITRILVTTQESSLPFRVRYAHLLSSALREEIDADVSVHNEGDIVQLECDISGSELNTMRAVDALAEGLADAFRMATGETIGTVSQPGISSGLGLLKGTVSDECFRKYALTMMERRNG